MRYTKYSDISIMKLLEGSPNLQSLYLDYSRQILYESVITIAGFRNLHTLSLGNFYGKFSGVNDMSIIMVIDACVNLQNLTLADCWYITDTSIIKLADNCPNLLSLDLHNITRENIGKNSNISDFGIRLAEVCSNLHSLDVSGLVNVTNLSVIKLTAYCQNIVIHTTKSYISYINPPIEEEKAWLLRNTNS